MFCKPYLSLRQLIFVQIYNAAGKMQQGFKREKSCCVELNNIFGPCFVISNMLVSAKSYFSLGQFSHLCIMQKRNVARIKFQKRKSLLSNILNLVSSSVDLWRKPFSYFLEEKLFIFFWKRTFSYFLGGKPFSYLCESKSKVASVSYSFSLAED